ncbi:putative acyl-CoA:6-aminopenicillanic-acid-acyltransferase [Daedalea quercina L-15889]|uniref:Putative acyl-CoA:6-aminopenicillanic-acid-acyltransferase n=1 Tax=Daedalea quercina L-15889 TaxID=1314783 RepID=A0A165SQS0_9APHY|nr:putative acyl-CoA:6-aminopenicillanic-acid-acyltransferase [Daedalea quercina L-15889]
MGGGRLVVDLSGSPYEIGLKHGRILASQILSQLSIYRDIFADTCKYDWPQVLDIAEQFRMTIGRLAPDLLEEIRGIADGVGSNDIGLLDIIALNARSEIALGKWDDGCTALAWKLGPSGKQMLAQNWDWRVSVGENLALMSIRRIGKPTIWVVTEPGIVGKIGFNSSSVGVCLNAIRARPISTDLLPIHLLLRTALECDSVDASIVTFEKLGGSASSQHILIADVHGARGLELSPRCAVYLREDKDGLIVHTNHFLENKFVDEPPWLSGSPFRLEKALSLCSEIAREVGPARLGDVVDGALLRSRVFANTENSPQAICCSSDPARGPLAKIETLFNIVMTFEDGKEPKAEVVFGRPGSGAETRVYNMPW